KHFHLIVAAPQSQGSVMAQALDIFYKFLSDICLEFRGQLIYGAGEHKVLPYSQTQLVTDIIEPVVRVEAAAPYTDHIVIGKLAVFQKLSGLFRASSSQQMLFRNIVGAHGKECLAVDLMGKALAPLILFNLH